jgi:prevent-host-death family protein
MAEVGIRALKQNASAVVATAASGEPVTITDRGRPVAMLVSIAASPSEALITADRARPALRSLSGLPAPRARQRHRPTLSATLAKMRNAERY